MSDCLYPVTIIRTRYGGVYEGAAWAAFALRPHQVPREATGDDLACAMWWEEHGAAVGLGATAQDAIADLEAKGRADEPTTRTVQEVATYLQDAIGPRMTAAIAGLSDPEQIESYARGEGPQPAGTVERRLREGFKVVRMLSEAYDADTARAWLFGTNSYLDERAPIQVLGQATQTSDFVAVVKAARQVAGFSHEQSD